MNEKILLINTKLLVSDDIIYYLQKENYDVITTNEIKNAFQLFEKKEPSLILVKIISGEELTFCREVKKISTIPIMGITALKGISERLQILEVVDDLLIQPFYLKELGARIQSLLRRCLLSSTRSQTLIPEEGLILEAGNISIHTRTQKVFKNQNLVPLTYFEYQLLKLLTTNVGKPLDRSFILNKIWKYNPERHADTRVVDVHIARLRKKIEKNPKTPLLILTVRGVGYKFRDGTSDK